MGATIGDAPNFTLGVRGMSHVFVSYSRRDNEYVDRIVAALGTLGHEVWHDRNSIRPAEESGGSGSLDRN